MEKGWVKGDLDRKKEGLNKRTLLLSAGYRQSFRLSRLVKPFVEGGEKDIRTYPLP
jgi:hypothetical protein